MRAFLVMAAVVVRFPNAVLYSAVGDAGFADLFTWKLERWPLTNLDAILAIAIGFAISGAFLRFTRRDLQGGFFARYGLMVMAIYIGGVALLGVGLLLTTVTISLDTNVMVPSRPSEILCTAIFAVVAGGVLGATEKGWFSLSPRQPFSGCSGEKANPRRAAPAAPRRHHRRRPRLCRLRR